MIVALGFSQIEGDATIYPGVMLIDTEKCTEEWKNAIRCSVHRWEYRPPSEWESLVSAQVHPPVMVEATAVVHYHNRLKENKP